MTFSEAAGRDTATYLYCLVSGPTAPSLADAPQGVPDAGSPRALPGAGEGGGLWLIVCTVPLPAYGEAAIERGLEDLSWVSDRAIGHERIVEHLLAELTAGRAPRRALIPLKLFTLFADDARAGDWLAAERTRLAAVAERLAGRVELGVRVRFAAEQARRTAARQAPAPTSGTDFLRTKKLRRDAGKEAAPRAAEAAARVLRELSGSAVETRRRSLPEGATGILFDAAFLVPAADLAVFEAEVERASRELAEEHGELTLTGPWPPYHFVGDAP